MALVFPRAPESSHIAPCLECARIEYLWDRLFGG